MKNKYELELSDEEYCIILGLLENRIKESNEESYRLKEDEELFNYMLKTYKNRYKIL